MIGYLFGKVMASDGEETLLLTSAGIGFQVKIKEVIPTGKNIGFFVSHIVREDSEELFGFFQYRDKKVFEQLLKVKGVGPKSAHSLLSKLGQKALIYAIKMDKKEILQQAPGIGKKSAQQIIFDLKDKISSDLLAPVQTETGAAEMSNVDQDSSGGMSSEDRSAAQDDGHLRLSFLDEAVTACKELGFSEKDILPLAQKILESKKISKSEELVHSILKSL